MSDDQATSIITGGHDDDGGDGQSLSTSGWSSDDEIEIDPDAPEQGLCSPSNSSPCFPGVIKTKNAPITKGYGDAQLATKDDLRVVVRDANSTSAGSFREIEKVEATQGLIYLKNDIEAGADVAVFYYYTPNPTVGFDEFNSEGYLFNQAGSSYLYQEYPFTSVFGPRNGNTQVLEKGHVHTAFQRGYTATFNDPTSLLFNEAVWSSGVPSLKRQLEERSISFEGNDLPTNEGWSVEGQLPSSPEFEEGLFIIDDTSSSLNVIDSDPLFYRQDVDLTYDHISSVNFRLKVFDHQAVDDFTGVSVGYTSSTSLYLLGFLKVDDFKFAGFLTKEVEENSWTSYKGLTAEIREREDENDNVIKDRLVFDNEVALQRNDYLFLEEIVYQVEDSFVDGAEFHVILTTEMPASLSEGSFYEVFPELDYTELTSYRLFKNEEGQVQAFFGGSPTPFAEATKEDVARGTEIFENIDQNKLFFGSVSRQGESRSGWEFVRYDILPTSPLESKEKVTVRSEFEVLPEEDGDHPWTLMDDQGYSQIIGDDLLLEQAGRVERGSFSYGRVEPLFTSQTPLDLRTSLRVDSYSSGIAASTTIADERKEVTIGLFSEQDLPASLEDQTVYQVSGGQVSILDPVTISTGGSVAPQGAFIEESPIPKFRASYSGTSSFLDEGWLEEGFSDISSKFIDRWHRLTKEGGSGETSRSSIDIPLFGNEFDEYLFSSRLRIKSWEDPESPEVLIPFSFGIEDSDDIFISLGFYDDGSTKKIVFLGPNKEVLEDSLTNNLLGVDFDWDSGLFHTYRVQRSEDSSGGPDQILLYIDGQYQNAFSVDDFPAPLDPDDSYNLFVDFEDSDDDIVVDLNYFFSHSTDYGPRYVGLFTGGDRNDPGSYDFVSKEWMEDELDIRVHRNPRGKTQIFLDDESDPSFTKQYSELPDRQSSHQLNTDLGFIKFGHFDPRSFAHSVWNFVEYRIHNRRENLIPLKGSKFNQAHVVSSPEGVFDEEPDLVDVLSDTKNLIVLSSKGLGAKRVLDVLSKDENISYAFDFDRESQEITLLDDAPKQRTPLKIRYLADKPYGKKYLLNQDPATRLNEGTPPFSKTLQKKLSVKKEDIDPDNDLFNGIEETSFNDGKFKYTYTVNDEALYESLDLTTFDIKGEKGHISSACDELGWIELQFDEWPSPETYEIPDQALEGFGNYNQHFVLDHSSSILDGTEYVLEPFSKSDINLIVGWLEEEVYGGADDKEEPQDAEIIEISGLLLDVSSSHLDSEDDTLDTWDESVLDDLDWPTWIRP